MAGGCTRLLRAGGQAGRHGRMGSAAVAAGGGWKGTAPWLGGGRCTRVARACGQARMDGLGRRGRWRTEGRCAVAWWSARPRAARARGQAQILCRHPHAPALPAKAALRSALGGARCTRVARARGQARTDGRGAVAGGGRKGSAPPLGGGPMHARCTGLRTGTDGWAQTLWAMADGRALRCHLVVHGRARVTRARGQAQMLCRHPHAPALRAKAALRGALGGWKFGRLEAGLLWQSPPSGGWVGVKRASARCATRESCRCRWNARCACRGKATSDARSTCEAADAPSASGDARLSACAWPGSWA